MANQNQRAQVLKHAVDLRFVAVFDILVVHRTKTSHNQITALPTESLRKLRCQSVVQISEWFQQHTRNVKRYLW